MRIGLRIFGLAVLIPVASMAAVQLAGEKELTLAGGSMGRVYFPHHTHQTVLEDCNRCHNLFSQAPGSIEKLKAGKVLLAKQVMNQCRDCHKAKADEGKKAGPTNCRECHKK